MKTLFKVLKCEVVGTRKTGHLIAVKYEFFKDFFHMYLYVRKISYIKVDSETKQFNPTYF